jgi:RimJ/RimL family protein N-acetyltransferase
VNPALHPPASTPGSVPAVSAGGEPVPALHTPRLVLRAFADADAGAVAALCADRAIADTTLHLPHPYTEDDARTFIRSRGEEWAAGAGATFAVTLAAGGALVGAMGLRFAAAHQHAELGYWVGVPHWGRGYATEAGAIVLAWAFGARGLHRVYAHHFTRNPASGRVLAKLGMAHEGRLREHVMKWDRFETLECYGILRAEWMARAGR